MHPSPATRLSARPRRAVKKALPAIVTGSLFAGVLATVGPLQAAAAPTGDFAVGGDSIPLNQAYDPEIGKITPNADAADNGMFGAQVDWPLIPLHTAVARNGNVISYGTPQGSGDQGGLSYDNWNPRAGFAANTHWVTPSMHDYNSFCNSIVMLADGRMLMVGGNSSSSTMIFDPGTGDQEMGAQLAYQRWYGTTLRLTDNRILILGGADYYNSPAWQTPDDNSKVAITPEIGTGTGAWDQLTGATSAYAFGARDNHWWYPRAFNGPNGGVVGFSGNNIWSLDPDGNGTLRETGKLPYNPGVAGSQVMYQPGMVLQAGGGQIVTEDTNAAIANASIIDFTGANPAVTEIAPMQHARNWVNLTVLPTGEVFANGGTKVGIQPGDDNAVRQSEIWNPQTKQWRTAATNQRTRTYHSVSLMLPSGALFTAGGGAPGPETNLNAELYFPPYLFKKGADGTVKWASRPAITQISGSATYGGTVNLKIGDGRAISQASLITLPSVTHAQNTDQRRIPLQLTQKGGTVAASLPDSVNTMPPGDYELTVVDNQGVPSAAQILTIERGAPGVVHVGDGQTADDGQGDAPGGQGTGTGVPGQNGGGIAEPTTTLSVDHSVGLEAVNKPGYRIGHAGATTRISKVGPKSPDADRRTSSWVVRPGLASSAGVSFESVDRPGLFLAAPGKRAGAVKLVRNDGTKSFAGRATFVARTSGTSTSFRIWANPKLRLQHRGTTLVAKRFDGSELTIGASTFLVRTGYAAAPAVRLTIGRSVGLESTTKAGLRVRHDRSAVSFRQTGQGSSTVLKGQTSWVVRPGLASTKGLSFESVDKPGWYLAAPTGGAGTMKLVKKSGAASFERRATFAASTGLAGAGTTLRLAKSPGLVLQITQNRLVVKAVDATDAGRAAATFAVRTGWSPAPTR